MLQVFDPRLQNNHLPTPSTRLYPHFPSVLPPASSSPPLLDSNSLCSLVDLPNTKPTHTTMAEVPTFKLVLVGDGGTGKARSSPRLHLALPIDWRIVEPFPILCERLS